MKYQRGFVMVFALLVLMSLTILGIASMSSGIMQTKMTASTERKSYAFNAAEAALAGVLFESGDTILLSDATLMDPLSEAIQLPELDLSSEKLSCFDSNRVNRFVTHNGLIEGETHTREGSFKVNPLTKSWSKTAYIKEEVCKGASHVMGASTLRCHIFLVKGCGSTTGSNYVIANSMSLAVFAPASK